MKAQGVTAPEKPGTHLSEPRKIAECISDLI